MPHTDLPLFPLSTVLYPGGVLSLRIFETRYLDLVRDCSRRGEGFGVCLILAGSEVGAAATPAAVGTLARIADFNVQPDGLLGIVAHGERRFRVATTSVRGNGLLQGVVRFWDDEPVEPVPAEYGLLVTILESLFEQAGGPHAEAERARFDDASWVGFRLAELLPLEAAEKQQLLELDDAVQRLDRLTRILSRYRSE